MAVANSTAEKNNDSGSPAEYSTKTIELQYRVDDYPGEVIELPLLIEPGDIVLAAIGINFRQSEHRNDLLDTDVKWVNGKVVGVEYVTG